MSDRSELMRRVLDTWEYSKEGQHYLGWLLGPEAEGLDGGAVLREAVLDLMEDDEKLNKLRRQKRDQGLEQFFNAFSAEDRAYLEEHTKRAIESFSAIKSAIRGQANTLRKIRRKLNFERLEALKIVSQSIDSEPPDALLSLMKNSDIANEVASIVAASMRTSTTKVDIETEWRSLSEADPLIETVQRIAVGPGEGWFDQQKDLLDRYYSKQVVMKLDDIIIDRAAALKPVALKVDHYIISRLFQEAHDAFLYGFDAAAIALCRSLIEHALKEKLSAMGRPKLERLINHAKARKILQGASIGHAKKVQDAGNKIMHDLASLRHTAEEVLESTRGILNDLYVSSSD